MTNNRKGQAALEFLTTYGWAFLIILVMVGAMYYFGWINVDDILPQKCQFGAEMHCNQWALDGEGGAFFKLKNALPDRVFVSKMEWATPDDNTWHDCETTSTLGGEDIGLTDNSGQVFNADATEDFVCEDKDSATPLSDYLTSDKKQRVKIRLTYNEGTSVEPNYVKYLYGDIHANVR